MVQPFGHEKLIVYQKAMHFATLRGAVLHDCGRRVAACDHLDRGAESILVNIAHASNTWSPKERIVYLGHANGSALECAACLDVLVVKKLLVPDQSRPGKSLTAYKATILTASLLDLAGGNLAAGVEEGRELLRRVAAMLTALSKAVTYD